MQRSGEAMVPPLGFGELRLALSNAAAHKRGAAANMRVPQQEVSSLETSYKENTGRRQQRKLSGALLLHPLTVSTRFWWVFSFQAFSEGLFPQEDRDRVFQLVSKLFFPPLQIHEAASWILHVNVQHILDFLDSRCLFSGFLGHNFTSRLVKANLLEAIKSYKGLSLFTRPCCVQPDGEWWGCNRKLLTPALLAPRRFKRCITATD